MVGICYVAPDVPIPNRRGSSTHVLELARALRQLGNDVHVICRREAFQESEEEISGVYLHRMYRGMIGPLSGPHQGPSQVQTQGSGRLSLYSLYLNSAQALFTGIAASRISKLHGLDAIIERETAFGAGAVASLISRRPMILEVIGPRVNPLSASVCYRALVYNQAMIPEGARSKSIFVKAAVNPNLFKPDPAAGARIRQEFGLDGSTVVGYVGTFQAWHGLADFIGAANIISRSRPDVRFLMVGPTVQGRLVPEGRELADSMKLAGPVPYETVPDYINAFDIAVAPYNIMNTERSAKGIGSPLKVLEYMACAKAVVGSSLPQVADLVEDGRTGYLFRQGDVGEFADRISDLIDNPQLRAEMGARGQERALGEFTWVNLARKLQSVIEESMSAYAE